MAESRGRAARIGPSGVSTAYTLLVLTARFWAGKQVIARGIEGYMSPVAMSFWRTPVRSTAESRSSAGGRRVRYALQAP